MIWVGFTSRAMPAITGWQATFFVNLQHIGRVITGALSWIPNWVAAALLAALLALLAWRALQTFGPKVNDEPAIVDNSERPRDEVSEEDIKEKAHEY